MNERESLEAAKRSIDDAIDALDDVDKTTSIIIAIATLTVARIAIDARLAALDEKA